MATPDLNDIYNFLAVNDRLGTAGQPTAAQFDAVQKAGYGVVINLATGKTPRDLANEAEVVAGHGMEYVQIPVVWEQPTHEDLKRFFSAMETHQDKKCFVHCIANMRVSAFVFLYRVLRQGVPPAQAQTMLNQLWQPNETWQRFIDEALERQTHA